MRNAQIESPVAAGTEQGLDQNLQTNNSSKPKKWQRVLAAFLAGKSYHRFEAERLLNDHCLHTTVSTLQGMGLVIHREFETVPGYQGAPTRVCRYWLAPQSRELAQVLLKANLRMKVAA